MMFTEQQKQRIGRRIAEIEARTGAEVVTTLAARCDNYPEIPWKAFALGTALAATAIAGHRALSPAWAAGTPLVLVSVMLGAGLVFALATLAWPAWARCFLDRGRAEVEARQYAESLFLRHELFGTRGRNGILILVAQFEHEIVILPDRDVRERVAAAEWLEVVARMLPELKRGAPAEAFEAGLAAVEAVLRAHGYTTGGGRDELPGRLDGKTPS